MPTLSVDQKISLLLEQSTFLLEKQKEAMTECESMYDELFDHIDTLIAKETKVAHVKELKDVKAMLQEQAEGALETINDDIDFLKGQRATLLEIQGKPEAKRAALLYAIIDKDEDIDSIESFKQDVIDESASSKNHLQSMIDDFKHALQDGDTEEIKMYLQSLHDDEDYDDEDAECGDCSGCESGEGCCSFDDESDDEYDDEDEEYDDEYDDEDEEEDDEKDKDDCCKSGKSNKKEAASRCKCGKFDSCRCQGKCK